MIQCLLCFLLGVLVGLSPLIYGRLTAKKLYRFRKTVNLHRNTPDKAVNAILNTELKKLQDENPALHYKGYRIVRMSQTQRTYELIFEK